MKNLITLSICLLVMTTSIASTYTNISFSKKDDGTKMEITLTLNDVKAGQKLSIKDENGVTLYNQTIQKTGIYNSRFDLSALPNGDYYFEHNKDYYTKLIPFTVAQGEVNFDKANEKVIYKPVVRIKNDFIYVSKLDLEQNDVSIDIYYSAKDKSEFKLVQSDEISNTMKIERAYRISEQHKGNYKVVIKSNGHTYNENFKI
ncbi:hypothetical protein [Formosa algae]|uniref:hypothetical protein n=1 Tax=Formosa algae TaxID=225843 RepID=UPI000CCFA038|nr:hypothetical protein [Formosa algae]PNW30205.1 hypothetical protein BKP44_00685 [Formosa algae]